jgi:large subunit ribosomal protein L22
MVKAELKNYRQSPRKVRLVADAIRGKRVEDAITTLTLMPKRAAHPVKKLLESAIANASHNFNLNVEDLFIKEIAIDEGVTLYRTMPRARGTAAPIRKRSSHIKIVLATKGGNKKDVITTSADTEEVVVEKEAEVVKKTKTKKINKDK